MNSIGTVSRGLPCPSVAMKQNIWISVGTAIIVKAAENSASDMTGRPMEENVMRPQAKAEPPDRHHRRHGTTVSKQRLAHKRRQHGGHHSGGWQKDSIDLGVAEQPDMCCHNNSRNSQTPGSVAQIA